ncbi:hypothetical protein [Tardiphaga sp. 803_E3_N1_3]|uniref:hypothetical protein n=1 Tax=Tardiphaga sp. 803_E3_N1_3 TaxID=3240785 RepID=UPI003F2277A2
MIADEIDQASEEIGATVNVPDRIDCRFVHGIPSSRQTGRLHAASLRILTIAKNHKSRNNVFVNPVAFDQFIDCDTAIKLLEANLHLNQKEGRDPIHHGAEAGVSDSEGIEHRRGVDATGDRLTFVDHPACCLQNTSTVSDGRRRRLTTDWPWPLLSFVALRWLWKSFQ